MGLNFVVFCRKLKVKGNICQWNHEDVVTNKDYYKLGLNQVVFLNDSNSNEQMLEWDILITQDQGVTKTSTRFEPPCIYVC